jgi:hypothetical protein
MADGSPRKLVDAQLIDAAAKDLNLWKPRWVRKETPHGSFAMPKESHGPADFEFMHDTTESVGQTFINFNDSTNRKARVSRAAGSVRVLRIVLIIVLFGITGVWLQSTPARKYLDEWGVILGKIIGTDRQVPARAKIEPAMPALPPAEGLALSDPVPSTNDPQPQEKSQSIDNVPPPEADKLADVSAPVRSPVQQDEAKKQPAPPTRNTPARVGTERQIPLREDSDQQRRELAAQVSKAIANRAIPGIRVSVIDGTALLNGRVATERQRAAAERAALTIPEVRGVQNRIIIE